MPGLVVGAYAGKRLGAIRDAKGKSAAAVFSELGALQKVEVRGIRVSEPVLYSLLYDLADLARARLEGVGCRVHLSLCL
jgi:hypothetical protein